MTGAAPPMPATRALRGIAAVLLAATAAVATAAQADETPEESQAPRTLVANLDAGTGGSGGIQRTLHDARPGFGQAFTTGPEPGGYALGSLGIVITDFFEGASPADHLRVTVNGAASGGGPGEALCVLTNPASFPTPGVIAFEAPAGGDACPQLAQGTTYFAVIEWVDAGASGSFALIPQTFPSEESAATDEDPGGAAGWSIADHSHYLTVASDVRTWTAYVATASFKIVLKEAVAAAATGQPTGPVDAGSRLSAADAEASEEDDSALQFAVTLDQAAAGTVTVAYATADGTATAGEDYTAASGTLTFQPGQTAKTVSVPIADDEADEGAETMTLTLSGATGADIETATATGTISDDDQADQPLTASFHDVPSTHVGERFGFRLTFSEAPEVSFATLRDAAFEVTGGAVRRARRAAPDSNLDWDITVQPSGAEAVTVRLPPTADCAAAGAVCTADSRPLSNDSTFTVAAKLLTASFAEVPASHGGQAFTFRLTFSEEPAVGFATLRDAAFEVTDGEVVRARRAAPDSNLDWDIDVQPSGAGAVTVRLPPTADCAAVGAICTPNGRPLSNDSTVTVPEQAASASVKGALITLAFPTPQDGFAAPSGSDFAVRVDGAHMAVTSVSLWLRGAVLRLPEPVRPGQAVMVDYLGSAMHPLRDAAGTLAPAWRDLAAVNATGRADALPAALPAPLTAEPHSSLSLAGLDLGAAGLAGLTMPPHLRRLDLSGTGITDLSPLAGLQRLRSLDLSDNAVTDLTPLRGLTELRRLDLSRNRIADLWPLGELRNLEVLLLDGNDVTEALQLMHLQRLEHLGLSANGIRDVSVLADLGSLRRLDLAGNPARDLSPVGDLQTLLWLRLPSPGEAAPVDRLPRLRWLLVPGTPAECPACAADDPLAGWR